MSDSSFQNHGNNDKEEAQTNVRVALRFDSISSHIYILFSYSSYYIIFENSTVVYIERGIIDDVYF